MQCRCRRRTNVRVGQHCSFSPKTLRAHQFTEAGLARDLSPRLDGCRVQIELARPVWMQFDRNLAKRLSGRRSASSIHSQNLRSPAARCGMDSAHTVHAGFPGTQAFLSNAVLEQGKDLHIHSNCTESHTKNNLAIHTHSFAVLCGE